jgi:hypothetical protein
VNRAGILRRMGRLDEAAQALKRAARLSDDPQIAAQLRALDADRRR